jgi:hypothetical protein
MCQRTAGEEKKRSTNMNCLQRLAITMHMQHNAMGRYLRASTHSGAKSQYHRTKGQQKRSLHAAGDYWSATMLDAVCFASWARRVQTLMQLVYRNRLFHFTYRLMSALLPEPLQAVMDCI